MTSVDCDSVGYPQYVGGSISTFYPVTANTDVLVQVTYVTPGNPCEPAFYQYTTVSGTILYGNSTTYVDPCTQGNFINSGAIVCSVCIISSTGDPGVSVPGSCQHC